MINVLDLSRQYADRWIALDARRNVVDSAADFSALSRRTAGARVTLYFVSA